MKTTLFWLGILGLSAGCVHTPKTTTAPPKVPQTLEEIADELAQAFVSGDSKKATSLWITRSELSEMASCSESESIAGTEDMALLSEWSVDVVSYLTKGPRAKDMTAELLEVKTQSMERQNKGQMIDDCTFLMDVEVGAFYAKYRIEKDTTGQHSRTDQVQLGFIKLNGNYRLFGPPQVQNEHWPLFAEMAQQVASPPEQPLIGVFLKACRAEAPMNVKAIKEAQMAYNATEDRYLAIAQHPAELPGKNAVLWTGGSGFDNLNWQPDGEVRGAYSVTIQEPTENDPSGDFKVIGKIDCDGDGDPAIYMATKTLHATQLSPVDVY